MTHNYRTIRAVLSHIDHNIGELHTNESREQALNAVAEKYLLLGYNPIGYSPEIYRQDMLSLMRLVRKSVLPKHLRKAEYRNLKMDQAYDRLFEHGSAVIEDGFLRTIEYPPDPGMTTDPTSLSIRELMDGTPETPYLAPTHGETVQPAQFFPKVDVDRDEEPRPRPRPTYCQGGGKKTTQQTEVSRKQGAPQKKSKRTADPPEQAARKTTLKQTANPPEQRASKKPSQQTAYPSEKRASKKPYQPNVNPPGQRVTKKTSKQTANPPEQQGGKKSSQKSGLPPQPKQDASRRKRSAPEDGDTIRVQPRKKLRIFASPERSFPIPDEQQDDESGNGEVEPPHPETSSDVPLAARSPRRRRRPLQDDKFSENTVGSLNDSEEARRAQVLDLFTTLRAQVATTARMIFEGSAGESAFVLDPHPTQALREQYSRVFGKDSLLFTANLTLTQELPEVGAAEILSSLMWSYVHSYILGDRESPLPWDSAHGIAETDNCLAQLIGKARLESMCRSAVKLQLSNPSFVHRHLEPAAWSAAAEMVRGVARHLEQLHEHYLRAGWRRMLSNDARSICLDAYRLLALLVGPPREFDVFSVTRDENFELDEDKMQVISGHGEELICSVVPGLMRLPGERSNGEYVVRANVATRLMDFDEEQEDQYVQQDTRQDVQKSAQQDVQKDAQKGVRPDVQQEVQQNAQKSARQNAGKRVLQDVERDFRHDVQRDIQRDIERDVPRDFQRRIQRDVRRDARQDVQRDVQSNVQQRTQQQVQQVRSAEKSAGESSAESDVETGEESDEESDEESARRPMGESDEESEDDSEDIVF